MDQPTIILVKQKTSYDMLMNLISVIICALFIGYIITQYNKGAYGQGFATACIVVTIVLCACSSVSSMLGSF